MTEQEKELALLLNSFRPTHREKWLDEELISAARALIQTYPQILAEKVFSGETVQISATTVYKNTVTQQALFGSTELTSIEVFIREVKE